MNEFDQTIKKIESELLAIKTASQYTSVRSANFTSSISVQQGLYRVTYQNTGEPIFSFCYIGTNVEEYGSPYPRTPQGNTQVIEVKNDSSAPLVIVSNVPVISITRI
jgi:hypothetical protein